MAKKKIKSKCKSAKRSAGKALPEAPNLITGLPTSSSVLPATPLLKVCRLCESKIGPFLNIFNTEKVTAKKIEDIMPFVVAENDDLPHKICFRCSAKVEELHEFIQKCVKTQQNLRIAVGKNEPLVMKPKVRTLWEEKLNKSNISNEDICDAVIKKAMEGIKSAPFNCKEGEKNNTSTVSENKTTESVSKPIVESANKTVAKGMKRIQDTGESDSETLKKPKLAPNKNEFSPRSSRSKNVEPLLEGLEIPTKPKKSPTAKQNAIPTPPIPKSVTTENSSKNTATNSDTTTKTNSKQNEIVIKNGDPAVSNSNNNSKSEECDTKKDKPFNIMEYICKIKVNGVGVLFQCKLCNRNFLKKEVVESHGCARHGRPKEDFTKVIAPPEPPKAPTVKYITTKPDNIKNGGENKISDEVSKPIPPVAESKPKPRIGPASKVKRNDRDADNIVGKTVTPKEPTPPPKTQNLSQPNLTQMANTPSIQFPQLPNLNCRYKLMPGPNNTFTLVEEKIDESGNKQNDRITGNSTVQRSGPSTSGTIIKTKPFNRSLSPPKNTHRQPPPQAIPMPPQSQPYPVGLFKRAPVANKVPIKPQQPVPFAIPASKKQSYTVVQTDNPSKLLISAKPQAQMIEPAPRKRARKSKHDLIDNAAAKEPFNVVLEDIEPPKNAEFFTFVNVDPLLQPSYVLPTDSIIQESQISTSSIKQKQIESTENEANRYSCNMCGEKFNREKKLLTHIHMHYDKMDEEDHSKTTRNVRKRGK